MENNKEVDNTSIKYWLKEVDKIVKRNLLGLPNERPIYYLKAYNRDDKNDDAMYWFFEGHVEPINEDETCESLPPRGTGVKYDRLPQHYNERSIKCPLTTEEVEMRLKCEIDKLGELEKELIRKGLM